MTDPAQQYIDTCIEQIKGQGHCVVLPEGSDERIVSAANILASKQICTPMLLAKPSEITTSVHADVIVIDHLADDATIERYSERYLTLRPKSKAAVARRLLKKNMYYAGMMVAENDAHALVAGAGSPTSRVIEAGLMTVGLADGITTPSSFFLMLLSENRHPDVASNLLFADCAVNPDPDAAMLADIAIASADSAQHLLNEPPRVALLSFSTHGSAKHDHVDKITAALEIIHSKRPDLAVDGELQADSALIKKVAAAKINNNASGVASEKTTDAVAGQANVLVFPDLDAGNIGYKLTQYLGGAKAIGPVLQGFAKPVCDLSRGASVDDIVASTALTLTLLQDGGTSA